MNRTEALELLRDQLREYRRRGYADLVSLIGRSVVTVRRGVSGVEYQLEVQAFRDDRPGGSVRVRGAIDDGGLRSFVPLVEDFIVAPDGTFVDE